MQIQAQWLMTLEIRWRMEYLTSIYKILLIIIHSNLSENICSFQCDLFSVPYGRLTFFGPPYGQRSPKLDVSFARMTE